MIEQVNHLLLRFELVGIMRSKKTNSGIAYEIELKGEKAIISVNRGAVDSVRACFAIWPERIEVKRVSGTLKGLRKKA